ncbi:MAG: hypothetical protein KatS3mg042_1063 [Rhodothermaceae bacterium]|nr:MAG: hypothetical protein KatS3mg042_1063 [Rhodothermaceae bacterium]
MPLMNTVPPGNPFHDGLLNTMRRLVILLPLILWIAPARAQDAPLEGTLPDSIVVTASRIPEDLRHTGRVVSVWTARDLAALPVSSFDELLRTVGGVEAAARGGFGVQSDVTMRGSTFNGVLVLLDGARFNDPMTGHFLTDFPVPLSEIARIEVLRGPAAAVYGPDALGGVIQVFTYAGLWREGRGAGLAGGGTARLGRHALYEVDAALRRDGARTLFGAATAWQGSDGQPLTAADGTPVRRGAETLRTDFRRQAHTLALAHRLGRATLYGRAGVDDRAFNAFHFYTPFASDTAREATTTYWAQLRVQGEGVDLPWEVQLSARQHEDTYVFNPQTPANRHTSRQANLLARLSRPVAPGLRLGAGLSASVRGIDSNNMGTHADAAAGAFATARWQATPALTLHAGARLDHDPGFGTEWTPQVSAAYAAGPVILRAAVARAVRAPNYIERYFNTTLARPRGRSLGNPDLRAERAWSYEAGLDLYPADGLVARATLFRRDTDDLIDYVMLTPADTVFLARNVLRVETTGLELDLEARRQVGPVRLRATAAYTYLDAALADTDRVAQYKYALTNARHLGQATLAVDAGAATLSVQALAKERLAGDAYEVVHLRAAYRLPAGRARLTLSAEVRNVFGVRYAEVFDAPMPGRWWLLGLRLAR